ncbi:hypothetical protein psyc5s11_30460 [Clostridium gelidum]|uniref:Shikimate kinase n=1 Tax=Clostridium gelidum TaxID=704125 RepID=A0ABM7T7Q0_9CLOT|nr:AAA family ATPase [Clostridium gelidum]BCZ46979.1 hypothetical protein psyc5s11_30460 [Clostridium gelidum]
MSIAIYVCGQIASGKTTISEQLSKELNLPLFKVDDIRKSFNNDKDVWKELITELKVNQSYIFESTGLSKRMEQLIINDIKLNRSFFIIKLICSKEKALERAKNRNVTFPKWEYSFTLEESIEWVDNEIKKLDADIEINTDNTESRDVVQSIIQRLKDQKLI